MVPKRTKDNARTFQTINVVNFFVAIMSKFTTKNLIFLTIKIWKKIDKMNIYIYCQVGLVQKNI